MYVSNIITLYKLVEYMTITPEFHEIHTKIHKIHEFMMKTEISYEFHEIHEFLFIFLNFTVFTL